MKDTHIFAEVLEPEALKQFESAMSQPSIFVCFCC